MANSAELHRNNAWNLRLEYSREQGTGRSRALARGNNAQNLTGIAASGAVEAADESRFDAKRAEGGTTKTDTFFFATAQVVLASAD